MKTDGEEKKLPDTYFVLVKRFPLTHIRDDVHLDAAASLLPLNQETRLRSRVKAR
jgi:hypothetical protein